MYISTFTKTIRDNLKALFFWGIGVLFFSSYITGFYPSIQESAEEFNRTFANMPEVVKTLIASEKMDLSTLNGFLDVEFFGFMGPFLFIAYAFITAGGMLAGEEEKGTLDLLLSTPRSRVSLALEKFASFVVLTNILGLILVFSLCLGILVFNLDADIWNIVITTLSLTWLAIAFGSFAFAIGAATGSRGLAMGLTIALAVGSYLLNVFSKLIDEMEKFKEASLFFHYEDLRVEHLLVLMGVSVALLLPALLFFARRDIAV